MSLSLLETQRQREMRRLFPMQDAQQRGDLVLECRDQHGQISHSTVIAASAAAGYQNITHAVQQLRPGQGHEIAMRDFRLDRLDRDRSAHARLLPVQPDQLPTGICSSRVAPKARKGLH